MIVEVDFGLGRPSTRMEERRIPVYGRSGGGVRYEERIERLPSGALVSRTVPVYDPPGTVLMGEDWVVVPVTTYEKYLRVTAIANHPERGETGQLWSIHVSSDDESNDLRKYLPILASAAVDHIGTTNGQQTVRLTDQSEQVVYIKQGL